MAIAFLVRLAAISPFRFGSAGTVLSAYFVRAGLYSNVSTWLTPPDMNRKMQRLAAGAKCGFFGASGFMASPVAAADRDSSTSSDASASAPIPLNDRRKTSRREGRAASAAEEF